MSVTVLTVDCDMNLEPIYDSSAGMCVCMCVYAKEEGGMLVGAHIMHLGSMYNWLKVCDLCVGVCVYGCRPNRYSKYSKFNSSRFEFESFGASHSVYIHKVQRTSSLTTMHPKS